jgi:flagellar biosynthesis/type III secretory pathway protein FliH
MKTPSLHENKIVKSVDAAKFPTYIMPALTGDSPLEIRRFIPEYISEAKSNKKPEMETPFHITDAFADCISSSADTDSMMEAKIIGEQKLREAMHQADRLMQEARTEADKIRKEASDEGYNAGYQQGILDGQEAAMQKARAEYLEKTTALQQEVADALSKMMRIREQSYHRYLDELKEVAIRVAEKIIHVSLSTSGSVIKKMILTEVENMKRTEWVRIYIDQYDYDKLMEVDEDILDALVKISDNVKFVVEDKESSGYCVIETPDERMDLGVSTQMNNIREALENIPYDMKKDLEEQTDV